MLSTLKKATDEAMAEINEEKRVRKTDEVFILFPMGSQFDHLIKQEAEKRGVFCLVADPSSTSAEDIKRINPKGIILSGGPVSVYSDAPKFDEKIFDLGIPVLGICLGFQLWAKHVGVKVNSAEKKEFGIHDLNIYNTVGLFEGCDSLIPVLQSHGDIVKLGAVRDSRLAVLAFSKNSPVSAARFKHLYGVQFHPEVTETTFGPQIFDNFFFEICGAKDKYPAEDVAKGKIKKLESTIGQKNVLIALSGGSDSSTCAYLIKEAKKWKVGLVHAVYIKGIDRPDDEKFVHEYFGDVNWLTLHVIDATDRFLDALSGKHTMKEKRVAMRGVYKEILETMADNLNCDFIVQGTLYTDISESGHGYDSGAKKAQIKLHHNVNLGFKQEEITPLDNCVKDSGRNIGRSIGVPEELLIRHPFPGPGLVVRIDGEITEEKLRIAHEADKIYIEELRKWGLYHKIWQAGVIVTNTVHTCTKGDDAKSGYVLMYFAVSSVNGFTAQPFDLPFDFRVNLSKRLGNEIKEVGATAYRDSGKPYSTIELG